MSAPRKVTIDNDELAREFLEDASVLGVQTPMEAHRFIWLLNRHFRLDLRYQPEAEILLPRRSKTFQFPIYQYSEPGTELLHIVYVNRHDGEYLLPEFKHFDYLWVLKSEQDRNKYLESLLHELRQLEQVQVVAELAGEKIKHKQHLVV